MIPWRRALLAIALAGLSACATLDKGTTPEGESISGRLSVRVDAAGTAPARSVSASFDLQGTPSVGQLNLSSPLGSVLAQAKWTAQQATLTTPDEEKIFPSLDALTLDMLGESLPVAALFDWLRGRPWPDAPSQTSEPPAPVGFQQLGWAVDTSRLAEGWVVAKRLQAPGVTVKARVEP